MPLLASYTLPHPPVILPEVGRGEERTIQKTIAAYEAAMREAAALAPDTLIITSPHAELYMDYFHIAPGDGATGNFSQFRAPQTEISVRYDTELVHTLCAMAQQEGLPAGTLGEKNPALDHGTMIPLYFFQKYKPLTQVKIIRIGLSGLSAESHYRLGQCIIKAVEQLGRRAIFLASGDLSHKLRPEGPYGFVPEGPQFDAACTQALGQGDFLTLLTLDDKLCEKAAECGLRSFWIMAGAWDGWSVKSRLLSYEGPFGVGYGVASFRPDKPEESRNLLPYLQQWRQTLRTKRMAAEDAYVRLARFTVERMVKDGKIPPLPDALPEEMLHTRAGAFVSLHLHGQLRGCIGTISPVRDCVAREILYNGVAAATEDPRFAPVQADELPDLEYSVDILGKPEPVTALTQLNPKQYGVIVESTQDARRGLLLPDLDGVDTVQEQIAIARQNAHIAETEPVKLWRFQVVRHA